MPLAPELEASFPGLAGGYEQTSEEDPDYNCIGHAAVDNDTWWEPVAGRYWPRRCPKDFSLAALQAAFSTIGYAPCSSGDLEAGVEKIAIFVKASGIYEHAARQLTDGSWTSKIGRHEDIRHQLHQLEDEEYGRVVAFMGRPRK